ncbi:MAG TPA: FAD-binding protein [Candidatus Ozemobacteraceae bacterium]
MNAAPKQIVVLIKFVADIERIPQDAWDTERGTLRRDRLHMIANPLDDRALQMALELKARFGSRVIAVSMGPAAAEEVLRRAVAYGADEAHLISDAAFAGSDTLATAHTLAAALTAILGDRRREETVFLAGMQSPDGDTAQVPLQIASLLDLPVIPHASELVFPAERPHGFGINTVLADGTRLFHVERPPALVTLTGYAPMPPAFLPLSRLIEAGTAQIRQWSNADLGLPRDRTGLSGSWTRVVQIFSPDAGHREAVRLDLGGPVADDARLKQILTELETYVKSGSGAVKDSDTPEEAASASEAYYQGECLIVCEPEGTSVSAGSRELVSAGRRLARRLGVGNTACVPETGPRLDTETLSACGADTIVVLCPGAGAPESGSWREEQLAEALGELIRRRRPQIVLIPASLHGRVVAPLLAARLGAGLTADCTGLGIRDFTGTVEGKRAVFGQVLHQTRPALGGNIMATIVSLRGHENGSPQMATARAGIFPEERHTGAVAPVERVVCSPQSAPDHIRVVRTLHDAGGGPADSIERCDVLISVGAGLGDARRVETLARPLAEAIARRWNVTVGVACSRAAMEKGYLPHAVQVGQTGKTVRPRVYIAIGISGAIQHRVGMEGAGRIVAVNRDPEAPILGWSDIALLGDAAEVVPRIIRLLSA